MKKYKVFQSGLFVGVLELTVEKVRRFNAEAVYTLIPVDVAESTVVMSQDRVYNVVKETPTVIAVVSDSEVL